MAGFLSGRFPFHLALAAIATSHAVDASAHPQPAGVVVEVVRGQAVAAVLAPGGFETTDFAVEWVGDPIPGVEVAIEPNTLQWVRVEEVLRIPRARLSVRARGVESGTVTASGFTQALAPVEDAGVTVAETVVALVSGDVNPIEVRVRAGGADLVGALRVRHRPRTESQVPRVIVDTTCSAYGVRIEAAGLRGEAPPGAKRAGWAYVGCERIAVNAFDHPSSSLEVLVFWDDAGEVIRVGGQEVRSSNGSVWRLRASAHPGFLRLAADGQEMTVRYGLPERPRRAFVGMGIGPYLDQFTVGEDARLLPTALVTFYGALDLAPGARLVAFNATALRSNSGYTDTGLYLWRKTSEIVDRRIVVAVFLGGHLLFFNDGVNTSSLALDDAENRIRRDFSAPQGLEVLVRDAGRPGYNLLAGALVNPGFAERSYYNVYIRWGSPRIFVEINYIDWTLSLPAEGVLPARDASLKSVGLSVGFPLLRFF